MKKAVLVVVAALTLTGCAPIPTGKPQPPVIEKERSAFSGDAFSQLTRIRTVGRGGVGTKTTDSPTAVMSALQKATPAPGHPDPEGTGDLFYLLPSGPTEGIALQHWPGNLVFDIQQQRYLLAPGIDEALRPLLPPAYLTLDDMLTMGRGIDPAAEWWPRFVPPGKFQVDGDQVWLLVGLTGDGKRLSYYVDPVSGQVLQQDPPETTEAAVAAVREIYGRRATGSAWHRDYWKDPGCNCIRFDVVDVTVEGAGTVHAARDENGVWQVYQ